MFWKILIFTKSLQAGPHLSKPLSIIFFAFQPKPLIHRILQSHWGNFSKILGAKSQISIVNSVAMFETQFTQKSLSNQDSVTKLKPL